MTKLNRIAELACEFDNALQPLLGNAYDGGCLILGRHYAQSSAIFLGLNPGRWPGERCDTFDVGPCSEPPFNSPFSNGPEANRRIGYFRNCEQFLAKYPRLFAWFADGVTSSFVSPWRSANVDELYGLNQQTKQDLFRYSGKLLKQMLEDHDAKVLVIVGKRGPDLLRDVLSAPSTDQCSAEILGNHRDTGLYCYSE